MPPISKSVYHGGTIVAHVLPDSRAHRRWLAVWWGAASTKGLDGGPLGFLMWGVSQLIGSLAYDAVAGSRAWNAVFRLLGWSIVLMAVGYAASILGDFHLADDAAQDGSHCQRESGR